MLAVVCDSTNVLSPGHSGSEGDIQEPLNAVIAECTGKVALACFATNVARLETIAKAAAANGRDVVLAGRSLQRVTRAARENGYLQGIAGFLDEDAAAHIPDDKLLIICTGSQGEPRAALARIAKGDHPRISMGVGDTVIFSSRKIPGNEVSIARMQNNLVRQGIKIITADDAFIHVSGHPNSEELVEMYQHVRPQISVPVHGERRHLEAHAALARDCQVPESVVCENGQMVRLAPGEAGVVDHVPAGRLAYDGNRMIPIDGEAVKERIRSLWHGVAVVSFALDDTGHLLGEPQVFTHGLLEPYEEPEILGQVIDVVYDTLERNGPPPTPRRCRCARNRAHCSAQNLSSIA